MSEKRYAEIDEEEYGAYWIVDVTNCDKTKKDFPDKDYPDDIIDIYAYEKYIQENGKVLESDEVIDLLNKLTHKHKMLSMSISEIWTKYMLLQEFSEDTNPNEAVKIVLKELSKVTEKYR